MIGLVNDGWVAVPSSRRLGHSVRGSFSPCDLRPQLSFIPFSTASGMKHWSEGHGNYNGSSGHKYPVKERKLEWFLFFVTVLLARSLGQGIGNDDDHRITAQEHLCNEAIAVDWLGLGLTLASLRNLVNE